MKSFKTLLSFVLASVISIAAFAVGEFKTEARFSTTPRSSAFQGENTGSSPLLLAYGVKKVIYLTAEQREAFRVFINNGTFYHSDGTVYRMKESMVNYVMDAAGNIYFFENKARKELRHSSMLAGEPVAAAGEATLDADGRLISINKSSGHYSPSQSYFESILKVLKEEGIDLSKVHVSR